jgi:hydrogenase/urease accessory protein HupE
MRDDAAMTDRGSTALLVAGYAAAVPFTAFVPGFLRLWRRREPWALALAQGGAVAIAVGWAAKGNVPAAAVNSAWVLGFGTAYVVEGRKRAAP